MPQVVTVLGIESSCDDTAAAIVRREQNGKARVLSSVVFGQTQLHSAFGGIVPEVAARAHAERLDVCTEKALADAGVALTQVDLIAVTAGPGLVGGLLAGVSFGKGLAAALNKPFLGINHLAGHALTARMTHALAFPYLVLIASGGHCQFLWVRAADQFLRLGGTIDDAPGEAFDKSARLLGLEQPGGPAIERAARQGNPDRFRFPRPLAGSGGCNMSFSGLKTALLRSAKNAEPGEENSKDAVADLAAGFQLAVSDVLAEKARVAIKVCFQDLAANDFVFAVCGGVAANVMIRQKLLSVCEQSGVRFVAPAPRYCTDNAAMIAWAGMEQFSGKGHAFDLPVRPRWPLDEQSPALVGSGKRGPKC